jgi:hypothetical protein
MSEDIIDRLRDLHKQATTERSHFYVARCCRDAIAEIESLRLKSLWRPIAEAPKDDTLVDLWRGEWGYRATNMRRVDLGGGNVFYAADGAGPSCVRDATHWMSIPEPPEVSE